MNYTDPFSLALLAATTSGFADIDPYRWLENERRPPSSPPVRTGSGNNRRVGGARGVGSV